MTGPSLPRLAVLPLQCKPQKAAETVNWRHKEEGRPHWVALWHTSRLQVRFMLAKARCSAAVCLKFFSPAFTGVGTRVLLLVLLALLLNSLFMLAPVIDELVISPAINKLTNVTNAADGNKQLSA